MMVSGDRPSDEPVRRALAEMRRELDDLIETEVLAVLARGQAGPSPTGSFAFVEDPDEDWTEAVSPTAEPPTRVEAAPPPSWSPPAVAIEPTPARSPSSAESIDGPAAGAGSRLDALARRLEGRLKKPRTRGDRSTEAEPSPLAPGGPPAAGPRPEEA